MVETDGERKPIHPKGAKKPHMKISKHIILSTALIALGASCLTTAAMAQDAQQEAKPMFTTLPAHNTYNVTTPPPPSVLNVWSSTYGSGHTPFTMVGYNPGTCGHSCKSTTPTFIIPIKVVIGSDTFNPNAHPPAEPTHTVIYNTARSPMFVNSNWTLGSESLTDREYIDAYQKASLWGLGTSSEGSYHVYLMKPTVLPTVTLTCGSPNCTVTTNPITGQGTVGLVDINLMDSTIQNAINSNASITPGAFPIALTYDVFLTSGGCCIGGYHSAYGGIGSQTYAHTTWIDPLSCGIGCQFSEDTAAFSHETGEWVEDPYVNNRGCGGLLEVGDPLVEEDYIQTIGGFNYHVQDLVFFQYFGTTFNSLNSWYDFRDLFTSTCENGPVVK
jgi:hypothetical protein